MRRLRPESCNCLHTPPYVRAWAEKYKDDGLVVIGVHTPEFAFEKDIGNVKNALSDLDITYPVAVDNDYAIWRAFNNQYWPAHYFAEGRIRHHHFGEGDYEGSERLAEAGRCAPVHVTTAGFAVPSDQRMVKSPESFVGYERAENFISPGGLVQDVAHVYASATPRLNEWALEGACRGPHLKFHLRPSIASQIPQASSERSPFSPVDASGAYRAYSSTWKA